MWKIFFFYWSWTAESVTSILFCKHHDQIIVVNFLLTFSLFWLTASCGGLPTLLAILMDAYHYKLHLQKLVVLQNATKLEDFKSFQIGYP